MIEFVRADKLNTYRTNVEHKTFSFQAVQELSEVLSQWLESSLPGLQEAEFYATLAAVGSVSVG